MKHEEERTLELRVTPPDQKPITDWLLTLHGEGWITHIVACEEGGEGTEKKLHYHAVIKTTYSDTMLTKWVYAIARANPAEIGQSGNAVFMKRKEHENSFGYAVKHDVCVALHGWTDADYERWVNASEQYAKEKKAERDKHRKIKALGRKRMLLSVEQEIADELKGGSYTRDDEGLSLVEFIIKCFLEKCHERSYDFPTKPQMEGAINRLRYVDSPRSVIAFYSRNLV